MSFVFKSRRARKRAAKWRLSQIIKIHRGCARCGYNEHGVALQFDHIDGSHKKESVSNLIRSDYAWETIKKEIAKCQVLCSNCHAVVTQERKITAFQVFPVQT